MKTSTKIVILACAMAILYAIASFCLQYFTGIEISTTLTGCWYTFWGVELINLASIKNTKVKNTQETTEPIE